MLDELINIKIKKILEKEYGRFVLVNGALLLLGLLLLGLSFIFSNNLIYIALIIHIIYLYLFKINISRLSRKTKNLLSNASRLKEFREYLSRNIDEYLPEDLGYIKLLEERAEVLSDIEHSERKRVDASRGLYKNELSAIKARILTSSIAGLASGAVMLFIVPINLIIKIIYLILIVIIIYYIRISL